MAAYFHLPHHRHWGSKVLLPNISISFWREANNHIMATIDTCGEMWLLAAFLLPCSRQTSPQGDGKQRAWSLTPHDCLIILMAVNLWPERQESQASFRGRCVITFLAEQMYGFWWIILSSPCYSACCEGLLIAHMINVSWRNMTRSCLTKKLLSSCWCIKKLQTVTQPIAVVFPACTR